MTLDVEAARSELIERLMLTDPSYEASFDRTVRIARSITGSSVAAFTILHGNRLFLKAHEGLDQREAERGGSFCGHAIQQPDLFVVEDARTDPRFRDHPLVGSGLNFYAGMPVRAPSGLPLGTLCVLDAQPNHLDARQREVLVDLARGLEESLVLRSLSIVDPLTGLFNRRHFEDTVRRDWRGSFMARAPLALAMIDIDHFKRYNDRYGHPAGDACLRAVSQTLRLGAQRIGDVIARLGGEEFVVLMPAAGLDDAREAAQRIIDIVDALRIPHADAPSGRVSVSVGLAMVADTEAETIDSALQRADDALYAAKRAGRGRVMLSA